MKSLYFVFSILQFYVFFDEVFRKYLKKADQKKPYLEGLSKCLDFCHENIFMRYEMFELKLFPDSYMNFEKSKVRNLCENENSFLFNELEKIFQLREKIFNHHFEPK